MAIDTKNIISLLVDLIIDYKIEEYKIFEKSNSIGETKNNMADLNKEFKEKALELIYMETN